MIDARFVALRLVGVLVLGAFFALPPARALVVEATEACFPPPSIKSRVFYSDDAPVMQRRNLSAENAPEIRFAHVQKLFASLSRKENDIGLENVSHLSVWAWWVSEIDAGLNGFDVSRERTSIDVLHRQRNRFARFADLLEEKSLNVRSMTLGELLASNLCGSGCRVGGLLGVSQATAHEKKLVDKEN